MLWVYYNTCAAWVYTGNANYIELFIEGHTGQRRNWCVQGMHREEDIVENEWTASTIFHSSIEKGVCPETLVWCKRKKVKLDSNKVGATKHYGPLSNSNSFLMTKWLCLVLAGFLIWLL